MLEGRSRHPLQPHRAASQRLIGHIAAPSKHPPSLWDHPQEGLRNVMGDRVHIEWLAGCMVQAQEKNRVLNLHLELMIAHPGS